jgi:4a-hydroxytetrahydrobiopterin dehydratase
VAEAGDKPSRKLQGIWGSLLWNGTKSELAAMTACDIKDLARRACVPCRGGVPPLQGPALRALHRKLGNDWKVVRAHQLEKEFTFPDFKQALAFTNRVGRLAERQGHHPDIHLAWGRVKVTTWTHKIDGLTENDFVLAARIEGLK